VTPAELIELVNGGKAADLVAAAATMSEAERRKLSETAAKLEREQRGWDGDHELHNIAELAVLAFCPLTQTERVDGRLTPENCILRVLIDRKPGWIDEWIAGKYTTQSADLDWYFLRELMKAGVCSKPKNDGYVRHMANELGYPWRRQAGLLSERLLAEPDLLDDVWRLFEVETDAFWQDNSWAVSHDEPFESWIEAITKLSADGHLDRQRLLDGCLSGLTHDFKKNALTGYIRLFDALEPTDDEVASRDQTLQDLLCARASHVVTFAMKMLKRLDKAKKLDAKSFLNSISAVFAVQTKGQPKTALTMIAQMCRRQPDLIPWAVNPVLDALTHEVSEIQAKAVEMLEDWAPRLHADHLAALRDRLDDLAPTVRPRVEALLGETAEAAEERGSKPSGQDAPDLDDLRARVAKLDEHWSKTAMVPDALDAIESEQMPGALKFGILDIPVLSAVEKIQPIETVDELIDAVSHAIEELESADERERILDGISRLGGERPDDFERRTEPLLKRIDKEVFLYAPQNIMGGDMQQLLGCWLRSRSASPSDGRLRGIARALARGEYHGLLAAPTHRHGWIEPRVLVERLLRVVTSGRTPHPYDLIHALLRLAPDNRDEALADAQNLKGSAGRILRWALGGEEGPTIGDRGNVHLWLAAGRSRQPFGELNELNSLEMEKLPTGVRSVDYVWRCFIDEYDPRANTPFAGRSLVKTNRLDVTTEPRLPQLYSDWLDVSGQLLFPTPVNAAIWQIQNVAATWPLNLQPFFQRAANDLMSRLESATSTLSPNHAYFGTLFEPDRPWPELAYLAVSLGLLTKDAESRTAALDALIEAIADGRVHPDPLGEVLVKVVAGGWAKLNRLSESLAELARVSPLHAWTAARLISMVVASFEQLPRDAHHLLTLLVELHTDLGLALDDAVRDSLASVKGASKTAKAAKSLLAHEGTSFPPRIRQAAVLALEARIERAERWTAASAK
jgi:uncharacterized protein DUF6493